MKDIKKILEKLGKLKNFGDSVSLRMKRNNLFLLIILLIFLLFNIYFSQKVSPIFFRMANNDKKAAVEFLQKIRRLPQFPKELKYYENIYGSTIKDEVFLEEKTRDLKITKFEQILEKNLQSRDILYSLYVLYLGKNDKKTAEKYLRLAREVDPTIK